MRATLGKYALLINAYKVIPASRIITSRIAAWQIYDDRKNSKQIRPRRLSLRVVESRVTAAACVFHGRIAADRKAF